MKGFWTQSLINRLALIRFHALGIEKPAHRRPGTTFRANQAQEIRRFRPIRGHRR